MALEPVVGRPLPPPLPSSLPPPPRPDREQQLVELVDPAGRPVGTATVARAHTRPGQLHRAFSVLLLASRPAGAPALLLQRRAASKTRFPLRWANACCGHPAPGEPVAGAAIRRLADELGLTGVSLTEIGVCRYRAGDPDSGAVEHEYDHVLLGHLPPEQPLAPDPVEVAALRWVDPLTLAGLLDQPGACAPWLAPVLRPLAATAPHWG